MKGDKKESKFVAGGGEVGGVDRRRVSCPVGDSHLPWYTQCERTADSLIGHWSRKLNWRSEAKENAIKKRKKKKNILHLSRL